jgi:transposase
VTTPWRALDDPALRFAWPGRPHRGPDANARHGHQLKTPIPYRNLRTIGALTNFVYVCTVSRAWITSDQGQQPVLLPVEIKDLLPADHLVWDILEMVDLLDLSAFEAAYRADGRGRPPYHPAMMLALILYCRCTRRMSGREIAAACRSDLGARLITGNRYPDRATIDGFIRTHQAAIKALLPQTLRIADAEDPDLVDVSVVAGDGTKVVANAAMSATVDEAGLLAQIADLQQQLSDAQAVWQELLSADHTEHPPTLFADTDTDVELLAPPPSGNAAATKAWRRVGTLHTMLRKRQQALAYLSAHPNTELVEWADRLERDTARVKRCEQRLADARATVQATHERRQAAEANGVNIPGTRPVPVEQHVRVRQGRDALATAVARAAATAANRPTSNKVNTTDPHSRIMPGKHDGFDQRHNVQALAGKNQFIISIGTHDSANDKRAMVKLVLDGRANLDAAGITRSIGVALLDNGYASAANFTAELPVELLLVAVEKEARQTERLQDGASTAAEAWQAMAERFEDPNNRKLYKQRGAIIEPLFAQLFARFGRYFNFRGECVDTELHLWAVGHNLLKIIRYRRKKRSPG